VRYFAEQAGVFGMVAGQEIDVMKEGQPLTLSELQYIHDCKTGALLRGAVVAGGYLGGASEAERRALVEYGRQFGIAFQIIDDILDVVGDEKLLGKPVGSDEANHKTTYVSLLGLDGAKQAAAEAVAAAKKALLPLGERGEVLSALADYYLA
jgi:geranylgeranyl diphosphate synthase type II